MYALFEGNISSAQRSKFRRRRVAAFHRHATHETMEAAEIVGCSGPWASCLLFRWLIHRSKLAMTPDAPP
jgi:hypothetical protein